MANEDLSEIERTILERKEKTQAVTVRGETPAVPAIPFENPAEKQSTTGKDTAGELVESAFNQAIVHKVTTDENVQNELLESAEKVIKNKTDTLKARADLEDKTAFFNNKKGACECFGYNETTTEKWAVKVMSFWHNIMTAIWLLIGFFTFAPVTFVAKKITVIFKKTWVAITIAIILYLLFVVGMPLLTKYGIPFITDFLSK